jgi:hypothetical protein
MQSQQRESHPDGQPTPGTPAQPGAAGQPPSVTQPPPVDAGPACTCGHPRQAHEHYRRGSDCALCGCARFRRRCGLGLRRR